MIAPEIRHFLNLAKESHEVAKTLFDLGTIVFLPHNPITVVTKRVTAVKANSPIVDSGFNRLTME
jgi:hypothetical protein